MAGQRGAAASGLLRNKTGSRQEEKTAPTLQSAARKQLRADIRNIITMLCSEVKNLRHDHG